MHLLGRINNSVLKEKGEVHNLFLRVYFYIDAYKRYRNNIVAISIPSREKNVASIAIPRNKYNARGFSVTHRNHLLSAPTRSCRMTFSRY